MKINGLLIRNDETGKYWAVEVPALGIHTQGKSKKAAMDMAKDAVETAVNTDGFSVEIELLNPMEFAVVAKDPKPLIGAILKRKRILKGLTAHEVAIRMGEKSATGYLRYEQGKTAPSIEKFSHILASIDETFEPILKIS